MVVKKYNLEGGGLRHEAVANDVLSFHGTAVMISSYNTDLLIGGWVTLASAGHTSVASCR